MLGQGINSQAIKICCMYMLVIAKSKTKKLKVAKPHMCKPVCTCTHRHAHTHFILFSLASTVEHLLYTGPYASN